APHWHGNWAIQVNHLHAPHHAVGWFHSYAAHPALAEVLLHFQNHLDRVRDLKALVHHPQRLVNRRHFAFFKLHVHCGTGNLHYMSDVFWHKTSAVKLSTISVQQLAISI